MRRRQHLKDEHEEAFIQHIRKIREPFIDVIGLVRFQQLLPFHTEKAIAECELSIDMELGNAITNTYIISEITRKELRFLRVGKNENKKKREAEKREQGNANTTQTKTSSWEIASNDSK